MGLVYSHVRNKLMRFNVENRAQKAIEKDKPAPAPQHPSSKMLYEKIIADTPDVKARLANKDAGLDKFLRDVYVSSQYTNPEIKRDVSKLPKERRPQPDEDFGFKLPSRGEVPEGYVNLKDAIQFITDHRGDPKLWTTSAIAKEYKLELKDVVDVLEHFRSFNVHISKVAADNKAGMYSMKRIREETLQFMLPDEKETTKESKDPPEKEKS